MKKKGEINRFSTLGRIYIQISIVIKFLGFKTSKKRFLEYFSDHRQHREQYYEIFYLNFQFYQQ